MSRLTKIFKASPTANNKAELRAAQQETKKQLFIMKSQQWDQWCNKIADMNAKDIWQEIKNIKGHPTAVKTLLPNQEANNLARHFTTRAAHDTLPEDVKHSLKQLQGQRRQSVLQAKLASTDTDVPFSIFTNLRQFHGKNKDSAPGEDTFTLL